MNLETMFERNPDVRIDGLHQVGVLRIGPRALIDAFGPPQVPNEVKLSGVYRFSGPDDGVFALFDWKMTDRYDYRLPSPEDFWGGIGAVDFTIAGRDKRHVPAFKAWLLGQIHHLPEK